MELHYEEARKIRQCLYFITHHIAALLIFVTPFFLFHIIFE